MGAEFEPRQKPVEEDEFGPPPRRKRPGIRIDMTPMVDVAFLLLIFFMVTTVFRRPLAMEVNMPEPGAKVEVAESNVMTIWVAADESLVVRHGKRAPTSLGWDELDSLFRAAAAENPNLVILVKINRAARYERMVDMMDTLEDAGMQRFSLIPMNEDDMPRPEGSP
jgi:biopolymer transport protein ExbD